MSSRTRQRQAQIRALDADNHRLGYYEAVMIFRSDTSDWAIKCGCGWKYVGPRVIGRNEAAKIGNTHLEERSKAP